MSYNFLPLNFKHCDIDNWKETDIVLFCRAGSKLFCRGGGHGGQIKA